MKTHAEALADLDHLAVLIREAKEQTRRAALFANDLELYSKASILLGLTAELAREEQKIQASLRANRTKVEPR